MDLTRDLAACLRADRLREAEHERVVDAVQRAGRGPGKGDRAREALGRCLIRTGVRLIGPVTQ